MQGIWLSPLTPVDKAAYIHDWEYEHIYARYNYSEFEYGLSLASYIDSTVGTRLAQNPQAVEALGWMGSHISLDPAMQLDLAWADTRLVANSWAFLGEGLVKGFYWTGAGQSALVTDVAWAGGITGLYAAISIWRVGMAGIGLVYQIGQGFAELFKSLGNVIGGDVGRGVGWIGDAASAILSFSARVFTLGATATFAAYVVANGAFGGVVGIGLAGYIGENVYIGSKVLEAGSKAIDWARARTGCFITEAVLQTTEESNDGPTLTILRRFRDEYVSTHVEGRRLLLTYREIAPRIVAAIEPREDRHKIWEHVRKSWIDPAVDLIRRGENELAFRTYVKMVKELSRKSAIPLQYDGSSAHWKHDQTLVNY